MRIFKPLDLSLQYKCFRWQQQPLLSVSILAGFRYHDRELLLEQDLWQLLSDILGREGVLDDGMPKQQGEVLLAGQAFAPGGRPVRQLAVGMRVGDIDKQLLVQGDRYWGVMGSTEPEPFISMPLDYAHAFGGRDDPRNPTGKGLDEVDYHGEKRIALPNIELPDQALSSKKERPTPAGFGPLDMLWQPRASLSGTYDERWVAERAPDYPDDLNWLFFNTAPPDQRLEGFFQGDEALQLDNLHPEKSRLRGRLPGYRCRCFLERLRDPELARSWQVPDDAETEFLEVPLQAETLWLFPEQETGVLIYRGRLAIASDDGAEIRHLLLAYENLADSKRTDGHYRQAMDRRKDPDRGYLYLMSTTDLIAAGQRCGFARMLDEGGEAQSSAFGDNMDAMAAQLQQQADEQLAAQRQQLAEQMQQAGMDAGEALAKFDAASAAQPQEPQIQALLDTMDKLLPGSSQGEGGTPDLSRLDMSQMDRLTQQLEQLEQNTRQQARTQLQALIEEARARLADSPLMQERAEQQIAWLEQALADLDQPPLLPRPPAPELAAQLGEQLAQAQSQLAELEQLGVDCSELPDIGLDVDAVEKDMQAMAGSVRENYRQIAHEIEGRPPQGIPLDVVRHRLLKALAAGDDLRAGDYAGIDLHGQDLSERDFSDSYFEYADLSACKLRGASLRRAVLAHANLQGADLEGADLREANLGDADLRGANLRGARLDGAILNKACLADACLRECSLHGIGQILEADLRGVDMQAIETDGLTFVELDMRGADFSRAALDGATFLQCRLQQARFRQASLEECNWIGVQADEADFSHAAMFNNRFPDNCSLRQARFVEARLEQSNFRDTDLYRADFSRARFELADFGKARLAHASFTLGQGKRAMFIEADLAGADMRGVNLMEGSLLKARLTSADLSQSNLYAVEFLGATVGDTDFRLANLDASKLEHWRP